MATNYMGISGVDGKVRDPAEGDFFPTPPEASMALLLEEEFPGVIWEPACGAGDLAEVMRQSGYDVFSSDKFDRGYGHTGVDFFGVNQLPPGCKSIVTNPPFKTLDYTGRQRVTTDWIIHGNSMPGIQKMALFMKTAALAGRARVAAHKDAGLKRVLQFIPRITTRKGELPKAGDNGGMIEFAWFVYEKGFTGTPGLIWIDKYSPVEQLSLSFSEVDHDDDA